MAPTLPTSPTPLHTPEPARETPPEQTTEIQLSLLKEDIRDHVRLNMDSVLHYCQKNKFNFSDWKNFDPARHLEQAKKVYTLLFGDPDVPPGQNAALQTRLQGIEKVPPDADVLAELKNLVTLLETLNEVRQETRERHEDLSQDIAGGTVSKVAEHVKGLFREYPLTTILTGGIALLGLTALYNHNPKEGFLKDKPIFKWAFWGTAGAFTVNHLLGPIFGGRDAIDAILDMPDSKFEELLAGAEEKLAEREVDKRAFRAMIHMGQIPFSVFLNEYARAVEPGNLEINMRSLQRAARRSRFGRQVPRHYFDQKNGKGLFAEMERLVGGKTKNRIAHMQQKYVDNGLNMSLFKVMVAEYDTVPEDAEVTGTAVATGTATATVSGVVSGTSNTPTVAAPAAPERKVDQPLTDELKGVKDLEILDAKVFEMDPATGKGKASIMGFTLDFVRTETKADPNNPAVVEALTYLFTVDPRQNSPLQLSLHLKETAINQAAQVAVVKDALEARMHHLLTTSISAILPAPAWNPSVKQWEINSFNIPMATLPTPDIGVYFQNRGLVRPSNLNFTFSLSPENNVEMHFMGESFSTLSSVLDFLVERGIEDKLRVQQDTGTLFRGLDIEVTDATPNNGQEIHFTVEGANFTARWDTGAKKYIIYGYEPSDRFVQAKSRAIQERSDFKKIFGDLALSGEKLSDFSRTALDYMRFRFSAADSKNHYWLQLVELKKFELVYEYEQALRGIQDGGGADIIGRLNVAEEEFARSLRSFNNYPNDLTNARDDANRYEALEKDFWMLGYGSAAYRSRTEAFYTTVNDLDFEGWTEKSNPVHQTMVFNIMRLWYERTRELKDVQSFSSNQTEYLDQLQQSFTGILGRGILQDTGFLQKVSEGISYDEFKRMRPEFDTLLTYMGWQIDTGRSEALIASLPLLGQVGKSFDVISGPAPAPGSTVQSATIDFGNGITWEIAFDSSKPAGEQIDLTKINMTPDMISAHVRSVENSSYFNKPFERLQNLWTNMEDQHWSELAKGNWRTFLTGTVEQGRWESLVEHKRREALSDYETDLNATLIITDPAARWLAWVTIQQNFGTRYLAGIDLIGTTVAQGIDQKLQKVPPEKLDQFDFLNAITDLQGAGYRSNGYILQMQNLRRDIRTFDYGVGWESLDSEKANDIMNKVIALQHKYMLMSSVKDREGRITSPSRHFRTLDNTEWTPDHGAYFQYVKLEIMHYLRTAYNNNADATGTWLDLAIGADEIPRELNLKTFEEFVADPNRAVLGHQNFEPAPGSGQAPEETAEQAAVRITRFRGRLDQILKEKFLDKVEANNTAQKEGWEVGNVDEDDAKSAEGELRIMLDRAVEHVKNNPGSEDQKADAFEDQVKAQYRALQGSRLWPWNWGQ